MLYKGNMSSREHTRVRQAVSVSSITASVLFVSKTAYFFCENSLIRAYHPVECFEPLIPPNLGQTLCSLGASSSSHLLGHRELVYKVW